ncbi:hypothetical protein [Candidatus Nitrospira allomarina]|uniref:Uncharacterized protein n=1 Tax=Candidatus Nitrospira allomarina TaxID=3020900 RepID=A0AA96GB14_9BACT|nr:hypothetical protein [Candidatus Nitrospira allomarina]WNM56875.1 hypothetical protein PP769_12910 [Candidatus Nitrospira allomarina]
MPALLAESSGGQTRLAQTVPALFLISSPRLGHAEMADPLVFLVQHAGGATEILVNQQEPSAG